MININKKILSVKIAAIAAPLLISAPAVLAEGFMIEEIVVTAQKRAESVQDVPVALTAFDQSRLEDAEMGNVKDLIAYSPGLTGSSSGLVFNSWAMRGISNDNPTAAAEPSLATYIDEAYIATGVTGSAFFDLNRVEVVRGPQGTLFGRNASAGAISLHTNRPDHEANSLKIGGGFGNEGQRDYEVIGNLAVSDALAIRLGGFNSETEGVQKNTFTGKENKERSKGGRLSVSWKMRDDLEALLVHQVSHADSVLPNVNVEGTGDDYPSTYANDWGDEEHMDVSNTRLRLGWDINDNMTLTSISNYEEYTASGEIDFDGTTQGFDVIGIGVGLDFSGETEAYSQEFRLNGSTDELDWFVGASWYKAALTDNLEVVGHVPGGKTPFNLIMLNPALVGLADTVDSSANKYDVNSRAIYGDVAWTLNDRWKVTAGIRYTQDEKDVCSESTGNLEGSFYQTLAEVCDSEEWDNVSPRLVVDYKLNEDIMLYASFAQGYKAGGPNSFAVPADLNAIILDPQASGLGAVGRGEKIQWIDPEVNDAIELGMKSKLLNESLQLNVSLFHQDYSDMQVTNQVGPALVLASHEKVVTSGFEMESLYLPPVEGLELFFNYTYTDTEIKKASDEAFKGNHLKQSPRNTVSLGANYDVDLNSGTLSFFGAYNWQDEQFYDIENTDANAQDAYGTFDAAISFEPVNGDWSLSLRGQNLTDKDYANFIEDEGFGRQIHHGKPRMVSLNFNYFIGD
jgi:iron complex outermembrane recepter protein